MRTFINYVTCDSGMGCGWDNEPMEGDTNETVAHMLRAAGWVRRGGHYICPECQEGRGQTSPGPRWREF